MTLRLVGWWGTPGGDEQEIPGAVHHGMLQPGAGTGTTPAGGRAGSATEGSAAARPARTQSRTRSLGPGVADRRSGAGMAAGANDAVPGLCRDREPCDAP